MSTKSIFWREREIDKVALRFAELMHEAEVADRYLSFISAIDQAQQEVLSEDRRRPRTSIQNGGAKFNDFIRRRGNELMQAKKAAQAAEDKNFQRFQEQQNRRESTAVATPQKPDEVEVREIPSQSAPPQYRWDQMIEALVQSITETFRLQLSQRLNQVTNETFENVHLQITKEVEDLEYVALNKISDVMKKVDTAKKRKVVIVGINKTQYDEIEAEFGKYLNLDFIDMKKSLNRLKASSQSADFVIANTTGLEHRHTNMLKHHPGLMRANGGSGQVKDLLLDICTRKGN